MVICLLEIYHEMFINEMIRQNWWRQRGNKIDCKLTLLKEAMVMWGFIFLFSLLCIFAFFHNKEI